MHPIAFNDLNTLPTPEHAFYAHLRMQYLQERFAEFNQEAIQHFWVEIPHNRQFMSNLSQSHIAFYAHRIRFIVTGTFTSPIVFACMNDGKLYGEVIDDDTLVSAFLAYGRDVFEAEGATQ